MVKVNTLKNLRSLNLVTSMKLKAFFCNPENSVVTVEYSIMF